MFVASRPFPAVANNLANGHHSHFGCVGQARRIVSLTEATHGMGQCPHAPLGPGPDVSKPRFLSLRSASSNERRDARKECPGTSTLVPRLSTSITGMCGIAGQFNFQQREPVERE